MIKAALLSLLLVGCASTETVKVVSDQVILNHPETLPAPVSPGVKIKVITVERIQSGDIPDTAYVGFTYNDWLEFAKWMHQFKNHNKSLKNALEIYKAQDSRNSELPEDQ